MVTPFWNLIEKQNDHTFISGIELLSGIPGLIEYKIFKQFVTILPYWTLLPNLTLLQNSVKFS